MSAIPAPSVAVATSPATTSGEAATDAAAGTAAAATGDARATVVADGDPATTTAVADGDPATTTAVAPVDGGAPPPAGPTSFFGPQWSGPGRPAGPGVLIGAVVAGVMAAIALPWDAPGLGWLVTAIVATAVVLTTAPRPCPTGAVAPTVMGERIAWTVAAVGLVGTGALRAAGWLFVLCLLAAAVCIPMTLVSGRSLRALFLGATAVPLAALRALPWALRSSRGADPSERSPRTFGRATATVLVSIGLVLVFGALLAGADPVFSGTLDLVLPTVDGDSVVRWIGGFVGVFLLTTGLCFLAGAPPRFDEEMRPQPRSWSRFEWALPVGALALLFAGFVAVQATVLFGGDGYVQRTAGVSYAEYARGGFWQLLVVTLLTLVVIGVAARRAGRETLSDRAFLRGLLGSLALLTLIIVASAMSRMWAYETAYGFTRLRLLVSACEVWLGLVFVLVLGAGIRVDRRATWLPRAMVATAAAALLGIVALNPDALIARENVRRYDRTGSLDLSYVSRLSADAVPALAALPEPLRTCALAGLSEELAHRDVDAWQHLNLGREWARAVLRDDPVETAGLNAWRDCPDQVRRPG